MHGTFNRVNTIQQHIVQMNVHELENALRYDQEFFIQFFLGDNLTHNVPSIHKVLLKLMTSTAVAALAVAIPRDHAKTTMAKLACVWYFLFSKYRYILYVSNDSLLAVEACKDIVAYMESDNFISTFGIILFETKQEGTGFYVFMLGKKKCILRARGAGQSVRGLNTDNCRPQLAVIDDLEDNDNIATEDLFRKLKIWFYGPFKKCLDKFDNKIIQVGNLIATQCLLQEHLDSPFWKSVRYGCILSDGTPLWPDAFPIAKLVNEYKEYQRAGVIHVWLAEMMNIPVPAGGGIIDFSKIQYRPPVGPGDCSFGFITVDPAISEETWSDKASVVAHGFVEDYNQWVIVEHKHEYVNDPNTLITMAVEMAVRWAFGVIGIENVSFQRVLQYYTKHYLLDNYILGIEVVPVPAIGSKTSRIAAWCAQLSEGTYSLPEGEFSITEQLALYDPTKKKGNKDDLIDGCSMGTYMIAAHGGLIMTQRIMMINAEPQSTYDHCPM